jgi:hypothetical protein
LEALERRVMVQIQHIHHIILEKDGGAYQLGEKLNEVGDMSAQGELIEANLLEEENEKQLRDSTL